MPVKHVFNPMTIHLSEWVVLGLVTLIDHLTQELMKSYDVVLSGGGPTNSWSCDIGLQRCDPWHHGWPRALTMKSYYSTFVGRWNHHGTTLKQNTSTRHVSKLYPALRTRSWCNGTRKRMRSSWWLLASEQVMMGILKKHAPFTNRCGHINQL